VSLGRLARLSTNPYRSEQIHYPNQTDHSENWGSQTKLFIDAEMVIYISKHYYESSQVAYVKLTYDFYVNVVWHLIFFEYVFMYCGLSMTR
jgi:hypothetical protein